MLVATLVATHSHSPWSSLVRDLNCKLPRGRTLCLLLLGFPTCHPVSQANTDKPRREHTRVSPNSSEHTITTTQHSKEGKESSLQAKKLSDWQRTQRKVCLLVGFLEKQSKSKTEARSLYSSLLECTCTCGIFYFIFHCWIFWDIPSSMLYLERGLPLPHKGLPVPSQPPAYTPHQEPLRIWEGPVQGVNTPNKWDKLRKHNRRRIFKRDRAPLAPGEQEGTIP